MSPIKNKKLLPSFSGEDEEREFWATQNTDDYFKDDGDVVLVPSPAFIRKQTAPRWLKLLLDPETMARLCAFAIERGISHHEVGRNWIRERLDQEKRAQNPVVDGDGDAEGILLIEGKDSTRRRGSGLSRKTRP